MKSLATFETKEAILKILVVKHASNSQDKQTYIDIQHNHLALIDAVKLKKTGDIKYFKENIQKLRSRLRVKRPVNYMIKVYLKKYKGEVKVQVDYMASKEPYKKFIDRVIGEAKGQIRRAVKGSTHPRIWVDKCVYVVMGSDEKGYVFVDEGSVLKAHVQRNMKQLLATKLPTMPRRYIGIELEFCAPIREEKFALKLFQNGIHKYAQLKSDGSLRPKTDLKEQGFELAILLEENTYKKNLKKITDVLKSINAVAKDRRCGLHVHVDMRRRDKDLVYNNLVACQYALLSMVDPNRFNNEFCRVVDSRKFPTEFTGEREERYKTINAAAYYKYRTIEVRMHEGSVDFKEISNWVDLLLKITNYPKRLKDNITKMTVLRSRMKLKDKLYNYALERSCTFQIQNNPNAREMRNAIANLQPRVLAVEGGYQNPLRNLRGIMDAHIADNLAIPPILRYEAPGAFMDAAEGIAQVNNPFHVNVGAQPHIPLDANIALDRVDQIDDDEDDLEF